jgi:hypothetical protein
MDKLLDKRTSLEGLSSSSSVLGESKVCILFHDTINALSLCMSAGIGLKSDRTVYQYLLFRIVFMWPSS